MALATSRPHGIPARPHPESTAVLERLVAGQVRSALRFQGLHQQRCAPLRRSPATTFPGCGTAAAISLGGFGVRSCAADRRL